MNAVPLSIEPSAGSEPADARPTIRSCRVPLPRRALRRGCVFRVLLVRRTASLVSARKRYVSFDSFVITAGSSFIPRAASAKRGSPRMLSNTAALMDMA